MTMTLDDYRRLLGLEYEQFVMEYNITSSQIHPDVRYEKIVDVTRVDLAKNQAFFFKDGTLKIIYISDDGVSQRLWKTFMEIVNADSPDAVLRSRAGKTSNQLVFAGEGITVSVHGDDVDFLELYAPCTLAVYQSEVYQARGPFIR